MGKMADQDKTQPPAVEHSLISPTRQSQNFPRPVMVNSAISILGTDKILIPSSIVYFTNADFCQIDI